MTEEDKEQLEYIKAWQRKHDIKKKIVKSKRDAVLWQWKWFIFMLKDLISTITMPVDEFK